MPSIDVVHRHGDHIVIKPRATWGRPVLAVLVFAAPLALGGAPYWSVPLFACLAMAALVITGADLSFARRDRMVVAWGVLSAMAALQVIPLPPWLLAVVDRESAEASAHALSAFRVARGGAWRAMHHDPGSGVTDLVYFLGLGAAYLASVRVSAREEGDRLLRFVASSMLLVAILALAHQITGQDRLYGVIHTRFAAPPIVSPLLNPNHLAAFTGAGAILWLGFAVAAERTAGRTLSAIAAVLCGVVCMLSLSRGGVAATVGCILLFVGMNARRGSSDRSPPRKGPKVWSGLVVGAAIILAGLYLASTSLSLEYAHGDTSKLDNMRRSLGLLRHHWLFGVGSGAVPVAVAAAGRLDPEWTFLRVECLPVDLAVSFGVPAALVIAAFGLRAMRDWWPPGQARPVVVGAWCAFASIVLHDFVDFSLFLGGVGYAAAVLGGFLLAQRLRGWGRPLPRGTNVRRAPAIALLAVGLALVPAAWRSTLEADRDRVEEALRADRSAIHGAVLRDALVRHPFDAYLPLLAGAHAAAQNDPSSLRFVTRSLELSPNWAQPHLLLARTFAAHGLRSQALVEVRETMARSATVHHACADILSRLQPLPTPDELEHLTPHAPNGIEMLDLLAARTLPEVAFVESVDALILRRDPTYFPALRRRAEAMLALGHPDESLQFCNRLITAHPALPVGYLCRGNVDVLQHEYPAALRTYAAGLARATDTFELQLSRARVYAALRQQGPMREAIMAAQEAGGSDLDRLVRASGLLGDLEAGLGNDRAAMEAYLRAHDIAAPERPYLLELIAAASRIPDRAAVEQWCAVLTEGGSPDPRAERYCGRAVPR